jgi:hypothetical protein
LSARLKAADAKALLSQLADPNSSAIAIALHRIEQHAWDGGDVRPFRAAIEAASRDRRTRVANVVHESIGTLAMRLRHARALRPAWEHAVAQRLTTLAKALQPSDAVDPIQVRKQIDAATVAKAKTLVQTVYDRAWHDGEDAATVAAALTGAIAHRDADVRRVACDAIRVASLHDCDLSPHVAQLVAALEACEPARSALAHAVRWPASHGTAASALRAALDGSTARPAAHALALGHLLRNEWKPVEALVADKRPAVWLGALEAIPISRRAPYAAHTRGVRAKTLRHAPADLAPIGEMLRGSATDRVIALELLDLLVHHPAAIATITPMLVDALGTAERGEVMRRVRAAAASGLDVSRWIPVLGGLLLDGDYRSSGADIYARSCLTELARGGTLLGPAAIALEAKR